MTTSNPGNSALLQQSPNQLQHDPSQMSFKAIAAMFINEEAKQMTNDISRANRDMGH